MTSQALRDPQAVVAAARRHRRRRSSSEATRLGAQVVVSTYNEPLITSEWAVAIFKEARAAGLMTRTSPTATARRKCSTTSGRGSISTRSISRASTTGTTAQLGGLIEPILSTIRALHQMGIWVEIVTLVIPGFNDTPG